MGGPGGNARGVEGTHRLVTARPRECQMHLTAPEPALMGTSGPYIGTGNSYYMFAFMRKVGLEHVHQPSRKWLRAFRHDSAMLIQQHWRCLRLTRGFAVSCECRHCSLPVFPNDAAATYPDIVCDFCQPATCCSQCACHCTCDGGSDLSL